MSIRVAEDITYEDLTKLIINVVGESCGEVLKFAWKKDGILCECSFTMGFIQQLGNIDLLVNFIWRDIETARIK